MWQRLMFVSALAFWLWYWLVQRALGPFGPDDTFFLHMFWMLKAGAKQYVDFNSYHLPLYFDLLTPLLPDGADLSFSWWLRGLCVLIVAGYAVLVRPALWPFMLAFIVFGRMAEIRPDTFGILLFNLAWFLLLKDRKYILLAAALSALAMLFSARAALMMIGMVLLLLWLTRNDRPTLYRLIGIGLMFVLAIMSVAYLDPAWSELLVRSVFINTLGLFPRMSLAERFLEIERISLAAMVVVALVASIVSLRRGGGERALIIGFACAAQLGLILADPLPYGYVYGWAMIPTLAGLSVAATLIDGTDRPLAWGAFASAAGMLALALSYPLRNGQAPAIGSYANLTLRAPLPPGAFAVMSTPHLVALTLKQGTPWDQLATREELCRRIKGTVAVHFWYQPICKRDAVRDWIGQTWTPDELEMIVTTQRPGLIIWGEQPHWPKHLLRGYDVYPGFALRQTSSGRP